MHYTQDESYYLLDAGPRTPASTSALQGGRRPRGDGPATCARAQEGGFRFPAERYVNRWPARKHDHFLIPGGHRALLGRGTAWCSRSARRPTSSRSSCGTGTASASTAGRGRSTSTTALANIQWDRTTGWVERELVNRIEPLARGDGWREERTGLHEREFIETRRHWFTGTGAARHARAA